MEKAVEKVNQDSGTYQADDFQRQEQESGKWQKGEDSQRCMTLVMAGKPIRDVWLGAVSRTGINRSRGPSRHILCRHRHQDQTGWMGGDMVEMWQGGCYRAEGPSCKRSGDCVSCKDIGRPGRHLEIWWLEYERQLLATTEEQERGDEACAKEGDVYQPLWLFTSQATREHKLLFAGEGGQECLWALRKQK